MTLESLLETVRRITLRDLENKSVFELLASASEELGELSRELLIEENTFGNRHKKTDEGSQAEAGDLVIAALAMYVARGGTYASFVELMDRKLKKYEESQNAR